MAKSLQLAAGLTAAPRAPVRRAPRSANGPCVGLQLDRWRSAVAANRRVQPVRASGSEDIDDVTDDEPINIAEVESLLTSEEPSQEEEGVVAEPAAEEPVIESVERSSEGKVEEASPAAAASQSAPGYVLNFLWLDRNVAVAVDQVFSKGERSPMTEYFFWPRNDAWEDLKTCLEGKPWIQERDKILLLNRTTEVINYWQDEQTKHSLEEAATKFPDCSFSGA